MSRFLFVRQKSHREFAKLLVERITLSRDEGGRPKVEITCRFGPPASNNSATGNQNSVVFEQADELREIGAGISLWANAMKALRKLGLHDAALRAIPRRVQLNVQLRRMEAVVGYEA